MSTQHQERRRRRLCIRIKRLRRRKDRICRPFALLDTRLGDITTLAHDVNELLGESETVALLTSELRGTLKQVIGRLEDFREYTEVPVDICDRLDKTFKEAEEALLEPSIRVPSNRFAFAEALPKVGNIPWAKLILGGAGISVVGVVGMVAVALASTVTMHVQNANCGDINLSGLATLVSAVPGIELPENISNQDTVTIVLPRFVASQLEVRASSELAVKGFGSQVAIQPGNLDLDASTWDSTSISTLTGRNVSVTGEHDLVLRCS